MANIHCDELFELTGEDFTTALTAAADGDIGTPDLLYQGYYDLNYMFRGLVICLDQDSGATGSIAGLDSLACPTVAYLPSQVWSDNAYSSAADPSPGGGVGGGTGGSFVCLPDSTDGFTHTCKQLKNFFYTKIENTRTKTAVLGFAAAQAKFVLDTSDIAATAAISGFPATEVAAGDAGKAFNYVGPLGVKGPMNSGSGVLVVCDEDIMPAGQDNGEHTAGHMILDAGLLAFTNNPNTNDILSSNGATDVATIFGSHAIVKGMVDHDRGLKNLKWNFDQEASVFNPATNSDYTGGDWVGNGTLTSTATTATTAGQYSGSGLANDAAAQALVAEAGLGPLKEKLVGAVITGSAPTVNSVAQSTNAFGRIMYDLIAGNNDRAIDASRRVGARNYVSAVEDTGTADTAIATALGFTAGAYQSAGAGNCKKQYLACKWKTGDTLTFKFKVDFSAKNLKDSGGNVIMAPSYISTNTTGSAFGAAGVVSTAIKIIHVDQCGDSSITFNAEVPV